MAVYITQLDGHFMAGGAHSARYTWCCTLHSPVCLISFVIGQLVLSLRGQAAYNCCEPSVCSGDALLPCVQFQQHGTHRASQPGAQ